MRPVGLNCDIPVNYCHFLGLHPLVTNALIRREWHHPVTVAQGKPAMGGESVMDPGWQKSVDKQCGKFLLNRLS